MKLVDDVKNAWKWFSMHAMGWSAGAISTWMAMPKEWQDRVIAAVPPHVMLGLVVAILLGGMFGRVVDQK
jgi:hypothetical protein